MGSRKPKTQSKAATVIKRGAKKSKPIFLNALNLERADSARAAVKAFRARCRTDYEDAIGDLITNLLHLARQDNGAEFDAEKFVLRLVDTFDEEEGEACNSGY